MKKLTALLLALTLLFTSACAGGEGTQDTPDAPDSPPVQEQTPPAETDAPDEPAPEPEPEPLASPMQPRWARPAGSAFATPSLSVMCLI